MTSPAPNPSNERAQLLIIGGGIVGIATAWTLAHRGHTDILLIDKEPTLASHQTGHNSGVLHSGIYYQPGSLKARLAVSGSARMRELCSSRGLPLAPVGKLILAASDDEIPRLRALLERGQANGVPDLAWVDAEAITDYEPAARGRAAIRVPGAASVDYRAVSQTLAEEARALGVRIELGCEALSARRESDAWLVETPAGTRRADWLVTCAGLHADRVAASAGAHPELRILPFRGEYYELIPSRRDLIRGLIYPTPDPSLPFLGVHLTRTVHGQVEAGPNAVLALSREAYKKGQLNLRDAWDSLTWPGLWRLGRRHWRTAVTEEFRSWSKGRFVSSLQRLVPELRAEDLQPAPAGVRAQALTREGKLVDDFALIPGEQALYVLNAPSPAATASLAIAEHIADALGLKGRCEDTR